jgi:hypothetical protein
VFRQHTVTLLSSAFARWVNDSSGCAHPSMGARQHIQKLWQRSSLTDQYGINPNFEYLSSVLWSKDAFTTLHTSDSAFPARHRCVNSAPTDETERTQRQRSCCQDEPGPCEPTQSVNEPGDRPASSNQTHRQLRCCALMLRCISSARARRIALPRPRPVPGRARP